MTAAAGVIWHDLECGAYSADLDLWDGLAREADGATLDLGCGTGRVALHLAKRGYEVAGVDVDAELVAAFNERAGEMPAEALVADARELDLDREFATVLAPMQLLQIFVDPEERVACLNCARAHMQAGGTLAVAIVDGFPDELVEDAPPPLPDAREVDGWVYSSLPLDATLNAGTIVVRRLRQTVSPDGELSDELDEIPLRLLDADTVEAEAREAGLIPTSRREIPPTETHVGSTVVLLERGA